MSVAVQLLKWRAPVIVAQIGSLMACVVSKLVSAHLGMNL